MAILSIAASALIIAVAFQVSEGLPTLHPLCTYEGPQPHTSRCDQFIMCSLGHEPQVMDCPLGPYNQPLFFNAKLGVCDYRRNVKCENGGVVIPPRTFPPIPPRTFPPIPPRTFPPIPSKTNPPVPQFDSLCYGTKHDSYGVFTAKRSGYIHQVLLAHESGEVSCYADKPKTYNRWGCSDLFPGKLGVYIARSKTEILYPNPATTQSDKFNFYNLVDPSGTNFHENSDFILFNDISKRVFVEAGEKLQVWYGEDLIDPTEEEINTGTHCIIVDVQYF